MKGKARYILITGAVMLAGAGLVSVVYSHCQMPCGIYDDPARLAAIAENITTIEKADKQIEELGAAAKPNYNQIVRWIDTKEHHANENEEIISYYFMAQRIAPADKSDGAKYDKYVKQLTLLHEMLITSMKTKQSTDLANVEKLRKLLEEFRAEYLGAQGQAH